MEASFNLWSLKIIYPTLNNYFKQALENIETNLVLIRDGKKNLTNYESIDFLNKIQKILETTELMNLSRILSVSEEALKAVKELRFDTQKNIEILEIILKILNNSATYIKTLVSTENEQFQFKNFYNDYYSLSKLLEKKADIKDLFFPKLRLINGANEEILNDLKYGIFINDSSKKNLIIHLKEINSILQSKLPTIINTIESDKLFNTDDDKLVYQNTCKQLYEVFDYAQKLKINKDFFILFGIYKLYVCVLSPAFNEKLELYIKERQKIIGFNLSKFENVLTNLIQNIKEMEFGEKTNNIRIDDENIKEIILELFYSLKYNDKLKEMPVYNDLKTYFDIECYIEQLSNIENLAEIKQSHENKIKEIKQFSEGEIKEIEKIFSNIKESFNLLKNKKGNEFDQILLDLINHSKNLTVSLSSSKEINNLLSQITEVLILIKEKSIKFSSLLQNEISISLILIEYCINYFIRNSVEDNIKNDYITQVVLQSERLKIICDKDFDKLNSLPSLILNNTNKEINLNNHFEFNKIDQKLQQPIQEEFKFDTHETKTKFGLESIISENKEELEQKSFIEMTRKLPDEEFNSSKNQFIFESSCQTVKQPINEKIEFIPSVNLTNEDKKEFIIIGITETTKENSNESVDNISNNIIKNELPQEIILNNSNNSKEIIERIKKELTLINTIEKELKQLKEKEDLYNKTIKEIKNNISTLANIIKKHELSESSEKDISLKNYSEKTELANKN